MNGKEFAAAFSSFINGQGTAEQTEAVECMLRDHRTLQQSTMRFCMQYIKGMAGNGSDLRNEASVELAKKITVMHTDGLPLI